ncbi:MAG: cell division protein FtsZ [Prevotella sp.]|nr:cell division protein FtsZ [Prevotella sp.]
MADNMIDFVAPIEDKMQGIIKVIGVGGGGCNAVRNMWNDQIQGVTYAVCNTDSQSLARSPVPVKMMLGQSGLGAGANPELGKQEAEANIADIEKLLSDGTKMVFVTAGMGGGTGTGAAPVVAGVAKQMGLLTVGVVTIPFYFEKKRKIIKALKGVDELRKNVDALLIVNNERLCDVYADSELSVKEAFQRADNILMDAVKGISELITMPSDGGIKSDFRDVETTMKNGGGAIMAMGRASGDHRVQRAILDALDSPLLYGNDIGKAKRILFNIYASEEHPIFVRELQEIDDFFDLLDPNIEVIWGTATDDSLGEDAKVTILATGLEDDLRSGVRQDVHRNEDDFYEDLIPLLYKPTKVEHVGKVMVKEQTLPFEVEEAQEPEPAVKSESVGQTDHGDGSPTDHGDGSPDHSRLATTDQENRPHDPTKQRTMIDKWKEWLNSLMAE